MHVSDQTSKSMLPRPRSSENVIAEEVYELCNSTTPAEVAAAEAVKKRGPPPGLQHPIEIHTHWIPPKDS